MPDRIKLLPVWIWMAVVVFFNPVGQGKIQAHDLKAYFEVEKGEIKVIAYYSDGTPAVKASIDVYDSSKKRIQSGHTDGHGKWSFPQPEAGTYKVVVDAGAGHRKTIPLTVSGQAIDNPGVPPEIARQNQWWQLILGLGVIGGIAVAMIAAVWIRKLRSPEEPNHEQEST